MGWGRTHCVLGGLRGGFERGGEVRFLGVGELGATASGLQGREVRVVAAVMNAVRQLGVVRVGAAASIAAVAGLLPGCRG